MKIFKLLFLFTVVTISFLACEPEELPESNQPQLENVEPVSENGEESAEEDERRDDD